MITTSFVKPKFTPKILIANFFSPTKAESKRLITNVRIIARIGTVKIKPTPPRLSVGFDIEYTKKLIAIDSKKAKIKETIPIIYLYREKQKNSNRISFLSKQLL